MRRLALLASSALAAVPPEREPVATSTRRSWDAQMADGTLVDLKTTADFATWAWPDLAPYQRAALQALALAHETGRPLILSRRDRMGRSEPWPSGWFHV